MKNCELFNVGDQVKIVRTHSNDLDQVGTITLVRPSYCKIQLPSGEIKNHTYGQFVKI
ncbi:hypothetical protein [Intestinibacter sp.]|uniref:hypothetical protein n=1 Tax=Intestinibacter sp. TaxID=1965304 RepID=UPI003F17E258